MVEMIGKFRVREHIGRGGMADVYLVENSAHAGFSTELCIKKIRREYANTPEMVELFESEARIIGNLKHDNIVRVYDFDRDTSGELFLVMEHIDGLDLDSILKTLAHFGAKMSLEMAVYILENLLLALHHAHTLKIDGELVTVIHRDVSPHNMLVSSAGIVKLADFGIAKAKGISEETRTGVIKGKFAYMSPEQLRGDRDAITPASDLFSAGLVFWEMVTCQRLFRATREVQVIDQIRSFDEASLPYHPEKVNTFLRGLLARDPLERFNSAEAALFALKKMGIFPCSAFDMAATIKALKHYKQCLVLADPIQSSVIVGSTFRGHTIRASGGNASPAPSENESGTDIARPAPPLTRPDIRRTVYITGILICLLICIVVLFRLFKQSALEGAVPETTGDDIVHVESATPVPKSTTRESALSAPEIAKPQQTSPKNELSPDKTASPASEAEEGIAKSDDQKLTLRPRNRASTRQTKQQKTEESKKAIKDMESFVGKSSPNTSKTLSKTKN